MEWKDRKIIEDKAENTTGDDTFKDIDERRKTPKLSTIVLRYPERQDLQNNERKFYQQVGDTCTKISQ